MNILFITLIGIDDINDRNLYADLIRSIIRKGHKVHIYSALERRQKNISIIKHYDNCTLTRVKTLNVQKSNFVEKVAGTLSLDYLMKRSIQKNENDSNFDLAIYTTPPITLTKTIQFVIQQFNCQTYLLLKDIFPQNAVDLGILKNSSLFYRYFRNKEKLLYNLSNRIGCMSQANVDYIIKHNSQINRNKLELCPNSIEPIESPPTPSEKNLAKLNFGINLDKYLFVYGGNLGKPQGIGQLIILLERFVNHEKAEFVIVGSGTEYSKLEKWISDNRPKNIILKQQLPRLDYDQILKAADVGLIFLDPRFTIPNFPSRLLSYLENAIPVLVCTDKASDMASLAEKMQFGFSAYSGNIEEMVVVTNKILAHSKDDLKFLGLNGRTYLENNYTSDITANIILS